MNQPNQIHSILKTHFLKKKESSRAFSLRKMAKQLEISPTHLSQIINGRRNLPVPLLHPMCVLLDIDHEKEEVLNAEILKIQGWHQPPSNALKNYEKSFVSHGENQWPTPNPDDFELFEDYRVLAILEATQLKDYDGSVTFLADRLQIKSDFVLKTLSTLKAKNFIVEKTPGVLIKTNALMEIQSRRNKKSIAAFHCSILDKAKEVLQEKVSDEDFQARNVSGFTFTCAKSHIPLLRAQVSEFLKSLAMETKDLPAEELYQLSVQLFPLTHTPQTDKQG